MAAPTDDPISDRLRELGIHRVSLPAANEMGRVNAWIVDDDPLVLVDAGIGDEGAFGVLEAGFREIGRRVEDVGLVLLTHQHTDHIGMAGEVVRRSGAELAGLVPLGPYLEDFAAEAAADRAYMAGLLRRHGADDRAIAGNDEGWTRFHAFGASAHVTVPLVAGSTIALRDRALEVLHRPGHSETDVLFVDRDARTMFGGDHLLRATASVPMRDRPLPAGDGARPVDSSVADVAVTVRYRESLRATRPLPVDLVLPGHGGAFGGVRDVVDRHLAKQERDAAGLLARAGDEPFTAGGLAASLWPQAPVTLAHVLLSTVLGSLGVLVAEGRVAAVEAGSDGPVRFRAT
jgi:glyoxylase-like metal-dependent hydrolase (beta-lactamase superfamily II)